MRWVGAALVVLAVACGHQEGGPAPAVTADAGQDGASAARGDTPSNGGRNV